MLSRDTHLPARRSSHLIETRAGTDLVVYDPASAAIHTLNEAMVSVWNLLDGSKTFRMVAAESGLDDESTRQALTTLADAGLLLGPLDSNLRATQSRRAFLRKAAIGGAVAVPMLASTTAVGAQTTVSCSTCANYDLVLDVTRPLTILPNITAAVAALLAQAPACTPSSCGRCYPYTVSASGSSLSVTVSFLRRCATGPILAADTLIALVTSAVCGVVPIPGICTTTTSEEPAEENLSIQSESSVQELEVTEEPEVTEPEVTEPEVTEPDVSEPEVT